MHTILHVSIYRIEAGLKIHDAYPPCNPRLYPSILKFFQRVIANEPEFGTRPMPTSQTFPISLKLSGRHVLIVGGGKTAFTRISQMLSASAKVTVIAREAMPSIVDLAVEGSLQLHQRPLLRSDICNAYSIVIGATNDRTVQQTIFEEANRRNILCNIVDQAEQSDFFFPAIVDRGALKISISTDGNSPVLAAWLRERLEEVLPATLDAFAIELGQLRRHLKIHIPEDMQERKAVIRRVLDQMDQAQPGRIRIDE